jgi:hypothetical protein
MLEYYLLWVCINKPEISIPNLETENEEERNEPKYILRKFFNKTIEEGGNIKFDKNYEEKLKILVEKHNNEENNEEIEYYNKKKQKIYKNMSQDIENKLAKFLCLFNEKNVEILKEVSVPLRQSSQVSFVNVVNEVSLESMLSKSVSDRLVVISRDNNLTKDLFKHFCKG